MDKLSNQLQTLYATKWLEGAKTTISKPPPATGPRTRQFARTVAQLSRTMDKYLDEDARNKVLDTIDLGIIYLGVDRREQQSHDPNLGYLDLLVLELLDYFKNNFFTWVNKPPCPQCGGDGDNMEATGGRRFPADQPNPDQVGVIETYKCQTCQIPVEFPRIRNPESLLQTRRGRCGEWVDCFVLILVALLEDPLKVRYVWNQEDHVWCEYYSTNLKRWVHLDPCEAAFDQPHLYWQNWGKSMSYVLGFGTDYCIDLLEKYIDPSKQIAKLTIVDSVKEADQVVRYFAKYSLIHAFLTSGKPQDPLVFYRDYLIPYNREIKLVSSTSSTTNTPTTTDQPQGRQLGSAEWTRARGEAGQ